jgi:hypothetical protein
VRRNLDEVAKLVTPSFRLSECRFDAEDLYEWFEAEDCDGRTWNVSRKHRQGNSDFDDYLRIVLSPIPEDEIAVGQKLADTLSCPVSFGEVTYIRGDRWDYEGQKRFTPNAELSRCTERRDDASI